MNYVTEALLKIKLQNDIHELIVRSKSELVTMADGTTVEAKIASLVQSINDITKTGGSLETVVAEACAATKKEILGYTDGDVIDETLDTIKEIAAWIAEHPDNTEAAQLVTDVETLKTKVGADTEGAETGLFALVAALRTDVTALQQAATRVEASATNGNIKVDGNEVAVYRHPDTHSADMIVDGENNKVLTNAMKAAYDAKAHIYVNEAGTTAIPEAMVEGDLLIQIVKSSAAE